MKVPIPNMAELQARFKQAPDITAKHVLTAGNKSLGILQGTAKQLAPISKMVGLGGTLRASILQSPMKRTGNAVSGSVGTGLKYAPWVEEGTGIYGPRHT